LRERERERKNQGNENLKAAIPHTGYDRIMWNISNI